MRFERAIPCRFCRKGREELLMIYFGPAGVPSEASEVEKFSKMDPLRQQAYTTGTMHRWVCTNCQQKMDVMITQEMIDRPDPSSEPNLQPLTDTTKEDAETTEDPLDVMREAYG